jgi:hypothetical protein
MNKLRLARLALLGLLLDLPILALASLAAQAQSLQRATIVSIGDRNNLLVQQRGRTMTVWLYGNARPCPKDLG